MSPTINKTDRIWSDPDYYKKHGISRGDVVAFRNARTKQRLWIKRIIGLPGEQISVKSGIVYINGKKLREDYVIGENNQKSKKFKDVEDQLQKDEVFVMGDNRDTSFDSRFNGPIKLLDVEAKVIGVYLSHDPSHIGSLKTPQYP